MNERVGRRNLDRRPPTRGDRQSARLVQAVLELLKETSIADLSVLRIAERAGVTRPVFYLYFESKYDVLAAALSAVWAEFDAARALTHRLDFTHSPQIMTRRLIADGVDIWHRHRTLIAAVVEARSAHVGLARLWDDLTAGSRDEVARVFGLLRTAGLIRPATQDLSGLVDALFGMAIWMLLNDRDPENVDHGEALVDVMTAVWVSAMWSADPPNASPEKC